MAIAAILLSQYYYHYYYRIQLKMNTDNDDYYIVFFIYVYPYHFGCCAMCMSPSVAVDISIIVQRQEWIQVHTAHRIEWQYEDSHTQEEILMTGFVFLVSVLRIRAYVCTSAIKEQLQLNQMWRITREKRTNCNKNAKWISWMEFHTKMS